MLNESDLAILKTLYENGKMLEVDGNKATITDNGDMFPATVAQKFLSMTCIREIDSVNGVTTYEMTPRGWQILSNPEIQNQLTVALGHANL